MIVLPIAHATVLHTLPLAEEGFNGIKFKHHPRPGGSGSDSVVRYAVTLRPGEDAVPVDFVFRQLGEFDTADTLTSMGLDLQTFAFVRHCSTRVLVAAHCGSRSPHWQTPLAEDVYTGAPTPHRLYWL